MIFHVISLEVLAKIETDVPELMGEPSTRTSVTLYSISRVVAFIAVKRNWPESLDILKVFVVVLNSPAVTVRRTYPLSIKSAVGW